MTLLWGGITARALLGKQRCRTCLMLLSSPGKIPQHQTSWVVSETWVNPHFVKDHPAQEGLRITMPLLPPGCCFKCKAAQIWWIHSWRHRVWAHHQLVLVVWAAEPITPEQAGWDCYQHTGWQVYNSLKYICTPQVTARSAGSQKSPTIVWFIHFYFICG